MPSSDKPRRGRPTGSTAKSAETREKIFDAAVTLFAERGYAAATMRSIAEASGTSVGLAYRYFPTKEAIVAELYSRQSAQFASIVAELPDGSVGARFALAMRQRIALMTPHRSAIAGLLGASLDPTSPVGVLSDSTRDVREHVCESLAVLVAGSTPAPPRDFTRELAELLYVVHLSTLLLWLNDRTQDATTTRGLLRLTTKLVDLGAPLLAMPMAGGLLRELATVLRPVFHPAPAAS